MGNVGAVGGRDRLLPSDRRNKFAFECHDCVRWQMHSRRRRRWQPRFSTPFCFSMILQLADDETSCCDECKAGLKVAKSLGKKRWRTAQRCYCYGYRWCRIKVTGKMYRITRNCTAVAQKRPCTHAKWETGASVVLWPCTYLVVSSLSSSSLHLTREEASSWLSIEQLHDVRAVLFH